MMERYRLSIDDFGGYFSYINVLGGKGSVFVHKEILDKYGENCPLFRYMPLNYLKSMIQNKYLWFSKILDMLDLREQGAIKFVTELKNHFMIMKSDNQALNQFEEQKLLAYEEALNQYISCWTLDRIGNTTGERFLMWKAYNQDNTDCCRIGITLRSLAESIIPASSTIIIAPVKYYNCNCGTLGKWADMVFEKTDAYVDEQEIRMLCINNEDNRPDHVCIEIEPRTLIKDVTISPFSSNESKLVKELKNKYDYMGDIFRSSIILEKQIEGYEKYF